MNHLSGIGKVLVLVGATFLTSWSMPTLADLITVNNPKGQVFTFQNNSKDPTGVELAASDFHLVWKQGTKIGSATIGGPFFGASLDNKGGALYVGTVGFGDLFSLAFGAGFAPGTQFDANFSFTGGFDDKPATVVQCGAGLVDTVCPAPVISANAVPEPPTRVLILTAMILFIVMQRSMLGRKQ